MAAAAAVGWVWLLDDSRDGQDRVMLTIPIALGTVLLLAIWLVFLSRLPWSRRRWAIGAAVAVIAVTAATTRIRGVTGDLVPILEWRWASVHRRRCRPSRYPNRRDRLRLCRNPYPSRHPLRRCPLPLLRLQHRSRRRHRFERSVTTRNFSAQTATAPSPAFASPTTGQSDRLGLSGVGQSARDGPASRLLEAWR